MTTNPRGLRDIFKNDKWLWIPGIIIAIILTLVIRGQQGRDQMPKITEEPTVSVYFHETGEIKSMPLETYLEGVVAAEMEPTWPLQALEAQAIVARTFTMKKLDGGNLPGKNAQASTDPKEFQAYNASRVNDRVKEAVRNTRGQVITYKGQPIMAWFHAASGGKTASAVEGLNFRKESTPYVTPVRDVQTEPVQSWRYTFTNDAVSRACAALGTEVGHVTSVRIGRKGPSGRAETLIVNGKEFSAPSFRLAIGDRQMKSTLLDEFRMEGDSVYVRGRGDGHGVGMSQWGAWLLAQRGKSAKDIVNYYYKDVEIRHLWE
ncbi:MAG: SpoIID/LytB domain-containing protein [Bacillota bacterium]